MQNEYNTDDPFNGETFWYLSNIIASLFLNGVFFFFIIVVRMHSRLQRSTLLGISYERIMRNCESRRVPTGVPVFLFERTHEKIPPCACPTWTRHSRLVMIARGVEIVLKRFHLNRLQPWLWLLPLPEKRGKRNTLHRFFQNFERELVLYHNKVESSVLSQIN